MTQLSLFDLPTASTTNNNSICGSNSVVAVPPASYHVSAPATQTAPGRRRRRKGSATQTSAQNQVEGVQRMGDLARLVIMRYELAAQQRALVAQRRAAVKA